MKFVGVSTGRSGSVYIARLFNRCGISTLHEDCFNGRKLVNGQPVWGDRTALGEWSAQAVPFLHLYPQATVFHQVRHPLDTISSLLKFRLFHEPERFGAEGQVITDRFHVDTDDPLRTAVRYWIDWNRRCEEHADRRWQVEQVDADLLYEVGALTGVHVDWRVAESAVGRMPRSVNSRGKPKPVTWGDIDGLPEFGELVDMAGRYGYDVRGDDA